MNLPAIKRATKLCADAIRAAEAAGLTPGEIAAGFAIAMQRLTASAAISANPEAAAKVMGIAGQAMRIGQAVAGIAEELRKR